MTLIGRRVPFTTGSPNCTLGSISIRPLSAQRDSLAAAAEAHFLGKRLDGRTPHEVVAPPAHRLDDVRLALPSELHPDRCPIGKEQVVGERPGRVRV